MNNDGSRLENLMHRLNKSDNNAFRSLDEMNNDGSRLANLLHRMNNEGNSGVTEEENNPNQEKENQLSKVFSDKGTNGLGQMSWNKNEAGTENIGGTLPNQEKENQLAKVFGDQGTNGLEHLSWNKNEAGTENNGGTLTSLLKRMNEGNNGNHMNENAEDPGQGQVLGLQHFSQDAGQTTSDLMKADKMADEREQEMENTEGESGIGGTRSMNDNRVQSMTAGGGQQANEQGGEMLPADVTWKIIEMMKRAAKFRQESESIFLQVGRDLASNGFTGNYQPEIHQNLA